MKKILVTGANGFVGTRLVQKLKKVGHEVVSLTSREGDIADPSTLSKLYQTDIDFAFHLASRTYIPDAWENPVEFQRVNVMGTMNVLELCRNDKIPLTYVSAYLYGIPKSLPIKESDRLEPNNPYALSKFMAEEACRFYAQYYNLPITIIRPFNIYGPGQKAYFLIPEIINKVLENQPIRLKDMLPRRDFLYLDDLVEALLRTIPLISSGYRIYNIGSGKSFSVKEIVETIQSIAGTDLPVINENIPRKNEIPDVFADIEKASQELQWSPHYSFEEGVRRMIRDKKE